ncbi:MAG: hypothetical protein P1V97_29645 [Planctomycetota bacterium]|nr:hypothetical protein [Planctomycetota bacterium]
MKRMITFGAAILAALSLNSVANAQEVTFKKGVPGVGESRSSTEETAMTNKMAITMNGQVVQKVEQKTSETKSHTVTVLARDGEKISKIKVHLKKKEAKQDVGQGPQSKKSDLVGKTFVLEQKGDDVVVTDEAGKKVDDTVAKEVKGDFAKSLGDFDNKFAEVLPDGAVKVGDTITVDKKKANKFFKDGDDKDPMQVEVFTLKLTGTKKINGVTVAVFEMHVKFSGEPNPGMKIVMDMKGTAHVSVDSSYPHLLDLKGPMTVVGKNQGMDIKGDGEMKMKFHSTYGKAGAATSKPTTGGN